ncbi:hypothetical protein CIPAW_07G038900 [Carya illinoinensis]|uniref:Uncharacterized protein n=1 Tax=Carya illinoinensis TaxID=32201 RepID=A0A8T1PQU6_CARIL|nr:hypothetical protein CIPAW_07G038900 [Carya illinoinensis]
MSHRQINIGIVHTFSLSRRVFSLTHNSNNKWSRAGTCSFCRNLTALMEQKCFLYYLQ